MAGNTFALRSPPETLESRTLMRITKAIRDGSGDFDEADIWALSQEALGLLDALIDRKPGPCSRCGKREGELVKAGAGRFSFFVDCKVRTAGVVPGELLRRGAWGNTTSGRYSRLFWHCSRR